MVVITEYDASWPVLFEEQAHRLRAVLGSSALRIEHVGSTSIPGLAAKPVIDIQVSVASLAPHGRYVDAMATLGYRRVAFGDFDLVYPFFTSRLRGPARIMFALSAIPDTPTRARKTAAGIRRARYPSDTPRVTVQTLWLR